MVTCPALPASAPPASLPAIPASIAVTPWHWPIAPEVELHVAGAVHPFPPVPRQPCSQALVTVLHTRPEVLPPQSVSVAHPQVPEARQAAPVPLAAQFLVWFVVHSTQVSIVSQTWPVTQSVEFRHATQEWGWPMVLQTGLGALQSVLSLHGSDIHVPRDPFVSEQYFPVAQFVAPASPRTRQPAAQVPVLNEEVSQ